MSEVLAGSPSRSMATSPARPRARLWSGVGGEQLHYSLAAGSSTNQHHRPGDAG